MQDNIPQPQDKLTLKTMDALKVFFDPQRKRIMSSVASKPRTVHEIADELNVPFTRLYYHIGLLEEHGIIRVVDEVPMAGAVKEKYYQIAARQFVVDRSLLVLQDDGETHEALELMLDMSFNKMADNIRKSVAQGGIDLSKESPRPYLPVIARRGALPR